ncbi:GNAT family N-acetyltransferase [Kiritimatiellota bacterium B12222]|nr:GNAT family N-acetyltransferase [Kiritimatiellota bacterium B12222]
MIIYRQIIETDIPALFKIRMATWENADGAEALAALGINPASVLARLKNGYAGWIAFCEGEAVGFSMANRLNGELWVIAVVSSFAGKGIGKELMRQAESWLFSHGWSEIWLTTPRDESSRAVSFYHHLGWVDWKIESDRYLKKTNPRSVIKLEEHMVRGANSDISRLVRLQRGSSEEPHRLCLFLDGEHYWRDMDALPILNALCESLDHPRMTFAFVGHLSAAARHVDYTCNTAYAHFIGEELMAWLKAEVPMIQNEGHVIVGLSLSGLMATYLSLNYPHHFGCCLSQSGSHWWKPEWFAEMSRACAPIPARFWLSVGDRETETDVTHSHSGMLQEISQIAGVKKVAEVLENNGGTVHLHLYNGEHSLFAWREELSKALRWLLS